MLFIPHANVGEVLEVTSKHNFCLFFNIVMHFILLILLINFLQRYFQSSLFDFFIVSQFKMSLIPHTEVGKALTELGLLEDTTEGIKVEMKMGFELGLNSLRRDIGTKHSLTMARDSCD